MTEDNTKITKMKEAIRVYQERIVDWRRKINPYITGKTVWPTPEDVIPPLVAGQFISHTYNSSRQSQASWYPQPLVAVQFISHTYGELFVPQLKEDLCFFRYISSVRPWSFYSGFGLERALNWPTWMRKNLEDWFQQNMSVEVSLIYLQSLK